ncbi:Thiol:disulfide interchange protein DsbB [Cupriavidus sp. OV038]|jgi:disulfide bond formation protein DsbB|uniref:disulfide bond formation protein B n=1 Tax=unclassified Cupriavidus TaxID=2640874 RepID=UPI0008E9173D|nr:MULTISPECIES: disulfide bond formation protein B [unclassified Cupriavidus]SFB67295.1 Thiol:disulfide interchange protein DsbB [Cupriavidus sp. OV038]SFO56382.1 Thiol:disulfide interchange protein DsbB [Cupriavidus sp. OV096]
MQANSRAYFLLIAVLSFAMLGAALYFQFVEGYQPCPLCIMQRFAFVGIGLFSLLAALAQNTRTLWQGLGMLSGVAGIAVAGYHVSLLLNPKSSCGIDPLENWVNALPTARLLPQVFFSDGLCTAPLPPLFGISIPAWSLIWLVILTVTLAVGLIRREKNYR